jgi:hypothetical protein
VHPVAAVGGFVATIFGGLAGAIYATYLDALRLSKGVFRATMSATLLVLALWRVRRLLGAGVFRLEDAMLIAASFSGRDRHRDRRQAARSPRPRRIPTRGGRAADRERRGLCWYID